MDTTFWHDKWQRGDIAFHEGEPNTLLQAHFPQLRIPPGGRVFLPLCGKTRDIAWLLDRGYRVAGSELSALAIDQLFSELGLEPTVEAAGSLSHYRAANIDILVGDFFAITAKTLGPVDAVYDRAALVALPRELRHRYTSHLVAITDHAPQLLVTFTYDQAAMPGPPFSIDEAEVNEHYSGHYQLRELAREPVAGGLKGITEATESAWALAPA